MRIESSTIWRITYSCSRNGGVFLSLYSRKQLFVFDTTQAAEGGIVLRFSIEMEYVPYAIAFDSDGLLWICNDIAVDSKEGNESMNIEVANTESVIPEYSAKPACKISLLKFQKESYEYTSNSIVNQLNLLQTEPTDRFELEKYRKWSNWNPEFHAAKKTKKREGESDIVAGKKKVQRGGAKQRAKKEKIALEGKIEEINDEK